MRSYILTSTHKENGIYKSTIEWNDEEIGIPPVFDTLSESESIGSLKIWLDNYLDYVSKIWLTFHQKEYRGGINCPNGLLQTGTDVWLCKLDKKLCELQAVVELGNEKEFKTSCRASKIQKDDILRIVSDEIYKGFHHSIGKYQCPICQADKKKEKFSFHYPWEFVPLIDLPLTASKIKMLKTETDKILSRFFADDPIICSTCAFELLSKLEIKEPIFKVVEYEIDRKNLDL